MPFFLGVKIFFDVGLKPRPWTNLGGGSGASSIYALQAHVQWLDCL